jgi:Protein of Unknown function (DUF2784)
MTPTVLRLAADAIALLHFLFIPFAIFGGLLVGRWPRIAWAHVPACLWGAAIIVFPWTCPLTPLEQDLRRRAGQAAYEGSFINHYITGPIAPDGVSHGVNVLLALVLLVFNALVYSRWLRRRRAAAAS